MTRLPAVALIACLASACGAPSQPTPDAAPDLPPPLDLGLDIPAPDAAFDLTMDTAADASDGGPDLSMDGPVPDAPPPPTHSACKAAQAITLDASGQVTVTDTTLWSQNEFGNSVSCGNPALPWPGPQGYYRVKLSGGMSYKVTLRTGGFDGALYAFEASTACSAAAINAACTSPATPSAPPVHLSSDNLGPSADELLRLAPAATGDWIVVVDSGSAKAAGLFQLTVAKVTPPASTACAQPQSVTLPAGSAVRVQGDTSSAANELGAAVTCGGAALTGPQLYYKVTLAGGDRLALTLAPTFPARAYVFSASAGCQAAAINGQCSGGGASGLMLSAAAGASASALLSPTSGGDFIVAVDSVAPQAGGRFTLDLRAITPPANASCVYAKDLTLDASGAVSVSGSTAGAADEFAALTCGGSALDGPQVYYKLKQLKAATTYRLLLTPSFPAQLYLFSTAAACKLAGIESDCQGTGAKGARLQATAAPNTTRSLYFKPAKAGDYFVAVDSASASAAGTFSLVVSETSAPTNTACLKAQSVALTAGKAEITGETHGSSDEFPGLKCGGFTLLDGPQVYYRAALSAGQTYKLALAPTFPARLYLYGPTAAKSCTEGALEQACASGGTDGLILGPVAAGAVDGALFTPKVSGDYGIAVDSADASLAGYFGLNIEPHVAPQNSACAAPAALPLTASPASVSGDTTAVKNEFGQAVTCGGAQSYDGPQLYYRLKLEKGTSYTLALTPKGWDAALYAFTDTTCTALAVTSHCALWGLADTAGLSGAESLTLTPATDGDVIVAVDGAAPAGGGPFALTVSWK